MAKRFTLTEKWDDTWFFALKPKYKLLWLFILDRCDHAGVWEANMRLASTYLGAPYSEHECLDVFAGKVRKINGSKWLIEKFIQHQYGCDVSGLNPENSAHKGVLSALQRYGIDPTKPLPSPYKGTMDKDKDKDKDIDKGKEEKKKIAEFVSLTDSEMRVLAEELGPDRARKAIEILDNYKGSKGKKYASDYRAIRSWVIGELKKREGTGGVGRTRGEVLTDDKLKRQVERLTGRPYEPEKGDGDSADSG